MRTSTRTVIALAATAGLVGATLPTAASSAAAPQWISLKNVPAPILNPMKDLMPWAPEDGRVSGTVVASYPIRSNGHPSP